MILISWRAFHDWLSTRAFIAMTSRLLGVLLSQLSLLFLCLYRCDTVWGVYIVVFLSLLGLSFLTRHIRQHLTTSSINSPSSKHLLLLTTALLFLIISVVWLWKPVGEVKQVLGDSDSAEEVDLRIRLVEEVLWEQLLILVLHNRQFKDLFAIWSHGGINSHQELYNLCQLV